MADEVHVTLVAAAKHEAITSEIILERALTLPHAVLYGMGVTIGAGIYVLMARRLRALACRRHSPSWLQRS